ncbi:hypothetical protein AB5I41_07540 [Sphingomonas sp. MMS24-JH45]
MAGTHRADAGGERQLRRRADQRLCQPLPQAARRLHHLRPARRRAGGRGVALGLRAQHHRQARLPCSSSSRHWRRATRRAPSTPPRSTSRA